MPRPLFTMLYVAAMIALIVGLDLLWLRHHFWARLAVNVGIVVVFGALYLKVFKAP